ncbi:equilibrative nucleoside transporter 2 isoform X1 [Carassius auratus]|uniref:Equilibrative nucleoside transporter 2-like isoform X1 n=1 Tax=Carassius auratus TaxID=7957 RepID=A0A6P6KGS9_CARAU|nr:equilibrative nucleoside transporter 2-like isoform X1 [Carassius auratus]XP_026071530.1 equilibrative nucleoside transporter 2-like isoform X1 [Carassius auratus]XP_026071531.1 equilibrative nucleoside transporter 2-like isoform X1 [Carassius auratus]
MNPREDAPADRGFFVGIIFFILGLGTLLPWNFFMTASMYFNNRLNTSEWSNGTITTRKEYYFDNWMTLLSQLPLLLFTFLNSFLYDWISEKVRIAGSLVFILILFVLTAVLVKISMEEDRFFSVTMATVWFINSFGAVLQGSLFGLVGLLPQRYSAIFMSGQGLGGTFAALAMIFAIASEADSESAALGYFITPCVGTLVTLFSYMLLPKLEFARFYLDRKSKSYELETSSRLLPTGDSVPPGDVEGCEKTSDLSVGSVANGNPNKGDSSVIEEEGVRQAFIPLQSENKSTQKSSILEVFKKIWLMAFCVTFVFTVTLSVFPAVIVDVKTVYGGKWERYFIPIFCFLLFNVMDFTGRTVTILLKWPSKDSRLFPLLVVCRVVFVPLLMMCNVQERHYMPVLFSNDIVFATIMLFFSVSSGYFVCLSMTYAPQLVEPKDAETAGALMTFFLALGLSLGAALSFPLRLLA